MNVLWSRLTLRLQLLPYFIQTTILRVRFTPLYVM
jgi:hypothetical protein